MIYRYKRNEEIIAEEVERDDLRKTVILKYLSGDKVNKTVCITSSTLKRWWTPEAKEKTSEVKEETPKVKEKTSNSCMEKEEKKMPSLNKNENLETLVSYITNTFENCWCASVRCYKIRKDGKTIAEIYPRKKTIEVRVKTVKNQYLLYKDGYKYYLPVHYFISYEDDYINLIHELLS